MKLADSNDYCADRDVEHTAQGDIYAGIPFAHAAPAASAFKASGARKRPAGPEREYATTTAAFTGVGVVLHYTCGRLIAVDAIDERANAFFAITTSSRSTARFASL